MKKRIKTTEILRMSCFVLISNGIKIIRLNFYTFILDLNFTVDNKYTNNRIGIAALRKYQSQL